MALDEGGQICCGRVFGNTGLIDDLSLTRAQTLCLLRIRLPLIFSCSCVSLFLLLWRGKLGPELELE